MTRWRWRKNQPRADIFYFSPVAEFGALSLFSSGVACLDEFFICSKGGCWSELWVLLVLGFWGGFFPHERVHKVYFHRLKGGHFRVWELAATLAAIRLATLGVF